MITIEELKSDERVKALISHADKNLEVIGYTEHGFRHSDIVSQRAGDLLLNLGFGEKRVLLAQIAGYLHDIGNVVNRRMHAQYGAIMASNLLRQVDIEFEQVLEIMSAIGNHHEEGSDPVSDICAALILADKSDVHRSRVRNPNTVAFDIHDRVNYAARDSKLVLVSPEIIELSILIDPDISSVMEYFEIFLERMIISRRASQFLGKKFELVINGVRLT